MDFEAFSVLLLCLAFIQCVCSRPFQLEDESKSVSQYDASMPAVLTFLAKSSETPSVVSGNSIPLSSSNAVSALTFLTLSYVTYVATDLYFPAALTAIGIPVLEDISRERNLRSFESPSQSFLGSVATEFVTDVLSKTEAMESVRNTSGRVLDNSVEIIKSTSKLAGDQVSYFSGQLDVLAKALSPGCLSRYMCKIGQFTSLHLPGIAAMLRSIDFKNLDDYEQAFLDGTTIGDCNSVFDKCDL